MKRSCLFTPKGKVFDSREVNVENSIDQYFYEEDGKYYMLWGSFFGIYIMELDVTDDVMITPKLDTKRQIAGNAYEGINLWKCKWQPPPHRFCEGTKNTHPHCGDARRPSALCSRRQEEQMLDNNI